MEKRRIEPEDGDEGRDDAGLLTTRPIWAEIDLSAIAHNIARLRQRLRPETRLMAVVKANAYGHGDVAVARAAMAAGADALGVARADEALALRRAGVAAPILIFGDTSPTWADALIRHDLTAAVHSREAAEALSEAAVSRRAKIRVHLKIDTGMGRLGLVAATAETAGLMDFDDAGPQSAGSKSVASLPISPSVISTQAISTQAISAQAVSAQAISAQAISPPAISPAAIDSALAIHALPGLTMEGVFTHFATADSPDKSFTRLQLARFNAFTAALSERGAGPFIRHAANSAAVIDLPETHLDMVRPGLAIYGLYPDPAMTSSIHLRPAMALKTRIVHLKRVPAGFPVSYGATYRAPKETVIASVPVGYADGYSRRLSSRGQMLAGGKRVPVVGRVCMDTTMLDVSAAPDAKRGDPVVIFGRQGDAEITADEVAEWLETINYEVVSGVMARVARVYSVGD